MATRNEAIERPGHNSVFGHRSSQPGTTQPSSCKKSRRALTPSVLAEALGPDEMVSALRCLAAMVEQFGKKGRRIGDARVLVLYGGGKDSSYAVAFVRAIQLIALETFGATFKLRVGTYRHPGMTPPALRANMKAVYSALDLFGDRNVELLLVDGEEVVPFDADRTIPREVRESGRRSLLMAAHRSGGEARASMCDACNLGMTRSFQQLSAYGEPVDLIVTGDSAAEQRRYAVWTKRAAERVGVNVAGARGRPRRDPWPP